MTKRIFRSIFSVAMLVLLASLVIIFGILYGYYSDLQKTQLRAQTELAAKGMEAAGEKYLNTIEAIETDSFRITWIMSDGTVLFDSEKDPAELENHIERAEIKQALATGYGESSRYSTTQMERVLYSAKKLPDGTVIRLSVSQLTVLNLTMSMLQPVLVIIVIAVILSLVLASGVSKKIVEPLNRLNLDFPASNKGYEELMPLLRRLSNQQAQLTLQGAELRRRQDEFDTATKCMNEGLVLLNEAGEIVSVNRAAMRFLGTDKAISGQNISAFPEEFRMSDLLESVKTEGNAEGKAELNNLVYQLSLSPVRSGDTQAGYALLIHNITEKDKAEQMRREFTANVSHELKTPLHSISGCAELIAGGMVKPEDIKGFAEQIYSEAGRMITLVDDIIKLSRLDEGVNNMQKTDVDLYALAKDTVESLKNEAKSAGIKLTLTGESAEISGIPQLLSGIIYNLCDNAIKYNRENGGVSVNVKNTDTEALLTVADTGIGIPAEHQERVFERFFRIDKSHSKEVGGTGLGLSIVKHSAKYHNARIELHSAVNIGTTIIVHFPKT